MLREDGERQVSVTCILRSVVLLRRERRFAGNIVKVFLQTCSKSYFVEFVFDEVLSHQGPFAGRALHYFGFGDSLRNLFVAVRLNYL